MAGGANPASAGGGVIAMSEAAEFPLRPHYRLRGERRETHTQTTVR